MVSEKFASDQEISAQLRHVVFPLLHDPAVVETDILLNVLKPIVQREDVPEIASLLKTDSLKKHMLGLQLLSITGSTAEIQDLLVPYLRQEETQLLAAKALSKSGYPGMIDILVEKGLKKLGNYSYLQLDVNSFLPYGAEADARLIQLMDYPNRATQVMVRILLAQMNSEKALSMIQEEFQDSLTKKSLPSVGDIDALMYYGKDPWAPVIELMSQTDKTAGDIDAWELPSDISRKSLDYFHMALLNTEDERKAGVLIGLIERFSFPDSDSSEALRSIELQHPNASIRSLIETHLSETNQKQ
jgi:hypothetical protein